MRKIQMTAQLLAEELLLRGVFLSLQSCNVQLLLLFE